jgi:hypothetical protein
MEVRFKGDPAAAGGIDLLEVRPTANHTGPLTRTIQGTRAWPGQDLNGCTGH